MQYFFKSLNLAVWVFCFKLTGWLRRVTSICSSGGNFISYSVANLSNFCKIDDIRAQLYKINAGPETRNQHFRTLLIPALAKLIVTSDFTDS